MVLTGAPMRDAPKRTAVDPVWLARASSGRSRAIPLPIVRMIGQPPSMVPAVSAAPQASSAQNGDARCEVSPAARSKAATIPIDFCTSFAPCVNARPPDIVHCPARTGPRTRIVARRATRRADRFTTRPARKPNRGANASTPITPSTPTGLIPSNPPQFTEPVPPSAIAAPTNPPSSAWPELDGRARHQVIAFHATAPVSAAPITNTTSSMGTVTIPAIVSATAFPRMSGPITLPKAASTIAGPGRAARVATSVAIALAASCKPLVNANASAIPTAITTAALTDRV